jgi:hypothetical protein
MANAHADLGPPPDAVASSTCCSRHGAGLWSTYGGGRLTEGASMSARQTVVMSHVSAETQIGKLEAALKCLGQSPEGTTIVGRRSRVDGRGGTR